MSRISNLKIFVMLVKYGWMIRKRNWWKIFPYLPIPPTRYMMWRFETVWGIDAENPKLEQFPPIKIMLIDTWAFGRWLCFITPK